jgi:DNA polymerase-3 subunit beta
MNFTVSKIYLKPALDAARKAVSGKSTLPILSYLKLEAEKDVLSVAGTNLEIGIQAFASCAVVEPGAVCAPAKLLCDFVDTYPDDKITMTTKPGGLLEMTCANNTTQLKILPAEEFPPVAAYSRDGVSIQGAVLKQLIHRTEYAASRDEARGTIMSVNVYSKGDLLRMEATDGFRCAAAWRAASLNVSPALIPALSLRKVGEMAREEEEVSYRTQYGRAIFTGESWQVECSVTDGQFPDLSVIRPTAHKTRVVVSTAELVRAIKRSAFLSDLPVRLHVEPGVTDEGWLIVMGSGEETGSSETRVPCSVYGPEMTLAFNPKFLSEGLITLESPLAAMNFSDPKKPALITTVEPGKDGGVEYIAMPMLVG